MPSAKKLKILFVTSEVVPFCKTGGLADVASALPQKLQELGHQVRIVVPKYGAIDERKFKIHEVVRLKDITTNVGEKEVTFSLRSSFLVGPKARVQIYFLDNEFYYGKRHSLYTEPLTGEEFEDNDERFILLAKSVFELIQKLGWIPDVIHCNDWQCGLVPLYLKELMKTDEKLKGIKTLYTVHNIAAQGKFPKEVFAKTGLPEGYVSEEGVLFKGEMNFLKAGFTYADAINTVSETYAKEICEDEGASYGLHEVMSKRKEDLYGIVNGIDPQIWNPEIDTKIEKKFSAKKLEDKKENKVALLEKFGFEVNLEVPLVGMISRITDVKGFDLVEKSFKELMGLNMQLVLLGTGTKKYHRFFEDAMFDYRGKFSCYLGFDDELAHLIEAGSDIFLIPSRYEACGLNQMYSQMYGTVPVVRKTGGLADTVEPFDATTGEGTGFVFEDYSAESMIEALSRAINLFNEDKKAWSTIQKNGMRQNFTWLNSSKNYVDLYKKVAK